MPADSPPSLDRSTTQPYWSELRAHPVPMVALPASAGRSGGIGLPGTPAHAAAGSTEWLSTIFSASLAHRLHGPLTALVTCAELLIDDIDRLDRAQLRALAVAIRCRTLWLESLVENLLCAVAIRDGRLRLQLRPMQLEEVVREVLLVVEPLLGRRRLRSQLRGVGLDEDTGGTTVLADGRRIGQALLNLLLNAGEHAPRSTEVDVVLSKRGDFLRVSVADRGPGLPPGGAASLFQHPARSGVCGQRGLGLAVVKALIEAHGGRVGASTRRGGGACFWFELPLSQPDSLPRPQ